MKYLLFCLIDWPTKYVSVHLEKKNHFPIERIESIAKTSFIMKYFLFSALAVTGVLEATAKNVDQVREFDILFYFSV